MAWRWREGLVGLGLCLIGTYWIVTGLGLLSWIGWAVVALGLVVIWAGAQRARFRVGADGPGVVTVDEGQVTYFGPLDGGAVAMSELSQLALDPRGKPPVWLLSQPGQVDLSVPLDAAGADALFDVFAALPGIETEKMLTQMRAHLRDAGQGPRGAVPLHPIVIWQKPRPRLH